MVNLDFIGFPNYSVTISGDVWSHITCKFLKLCCNTQGYLHVSLCNKGETKTHTVHRLVGLCFNNESFKEGFHCHHRDGDILNNHSSNLEWLSPQDHLLKGWELGQYKCKYTRSVLSEVGHMLNKGLTDKDIAFSTGLPQYTVSEFRTGKMDTQESCKIKRSPVKLKTRLTDDQIRSILDLLSQGKTDAEVSRLTHIKRKTINRLRSGQFYKNSHLVLGTSATDLKREGRLTKEVVFRILDLRGNMSLKRISILLDIHYDKVRNVVYGKCYKDFIKEYNEIADQLAVKASTKLKESSQ
jgi:hypothetical protein